jgi:hypothetical protein
MERRLTMFHLLRSLTVAAMVLSLSTAARAEEKKETKKAPAKAEAKKAPEKAEAKKGEAKKGEAKKGETKKGEEKGEAKKEGAMSPEMEAMVKAATPGAQHKVLKMMAGTYSAAVTAYMPKAKPVKSAGTSVNKMILGDRFLSQEFSGKMMGKPFSGVGLTGYDNTQKKFVYVWADEMSTTLVYMDGTADKTGKVITVDGVFPDPATGKPKKVRGVTRITNDKKHTFDWYEVPEKGKPVKSLEIVYTRK